MEVFIGSIFLFGGNFAPFGFALCNGQILPITSNTTLFSILGVTYGGDGQQTFGLPDLRGRLPIGFGQGQGLPVYSIGDVGGKESAVLLPTNFPSHTHALKGDDTAGNAQLPGPSTVLGACTTTNQIYSANAPNVTMSPRSIGSTGTSTAFSVQQPFSAMNFIIATQGIFPSRN